MSSPVCCSGISHTDNRELEGRIFHIAKEYQVPLFEKDVTVEKKIESLYRNFKLYLRSRTDFDKQNGGKTQNGATPASVQPAENKMIEHLASINRIAGTHLIGFDIPESLTYLWNYMLTAYRTAAFIESCPADQDIIHHYKEQLNLWKQRESLQVPTKTHTIRKKS